MSDLATKTLPALPLTSGVVLPQMVLTIALETDQAKAAADAAQPSGELVLVPRVDGQYGAVGVLAHIEDLMTRGIITSDGPPSIEGRYRLAR